MCSSDLDIRFNRRIGGYAGQPWSVDGRLLSPEAHARHLEAALPQRADVELANSFMRDTDWIAPKKASDAVGG